MGEPEVLKSKLLEKMIYCLQVISDPHPTHVCIVMSLQLFVALSILCGYYFEDGIYPTAAFGNRMDVSYRWLTITLCMYIWGEPEQLAWSRENMMQPTNQLTDGLIEKCLSQ